MYVCLYVCYVMSCHVMLCYVMLCYVMYVCVCVCMCMCIYICIYIYIYIYTYDPARGRPREVALLTRATWTTTGGPGGCRQSNVSVGTFRIDLCTPDELT